jgi:hypothetical protein
MVVEKLKFAAAILVLTVLGAVTATSVLRAYQAPAEKLPEAIPASVGRATGPQAPERVPNTSDRTPAPTANGKVDEDAAVSRLEELRVEADLLEITIEVEKASIKAAAEFLKRAEGTGPHGLGLAKDKEELKRQLDEFEVSIARTKRQLSDDQRSYRDHRIRLAVLRRQLAREAKALKEPEEARVSASDLTRRLDRLEEKLDRVIRELPGAK